jgi:hypothetical protein
MSAKSDAIRAHANLDQRINAIQNHLAWIDKRIAQVDEVRAVYAAQGIQGDYRIPVANEVADLLHRLKSSLEEQMELVRILEMVLPPVKVEKIAFTLDAAGMPTGATKYSA